MSVKGRKLEAYLVVPSPPGTIPLPLPVECWALEDDPPAPDLQPPTIILLPPSTEPEIVKSVDQPQPPDYGPIPDPLG